MSGILDNKSRIIDTIITDEGRRQLARGGLDVQYFTFTDATVFYRPDLVSGSQDASRLIQLESCDLPQDSITFRANIDGRLEPFRNSRGFDMSAGSVLQSIMTQSGSSWTQEIVPARGVTLEAASAELLSSAADNFRKMYLLASRDAVFEEDQFVMAPDNVSFVITDDRPLKGKEQHVAHLTSLDSVHTDPRFSDKLNFRFMPPVNKLDDDSIDRADYRETANRTLATYKPLGRTQASRLSWTQLSHELRYYADLGYVRNITFDPTSAENHLVGQFFERSDNTLKKLDVVDHGTHLTGDPATPVVRVFFVGKVEVDERGTDTFIHLFTLVFE